MSKITRDLQKARNTLKTRGMCKGVLQKGEDGPCCMMGAVWTLKSKFGNRANAVAEVLEFVVPNNNIVRFNDDPATTKKDALRMFDAAISLALSEGL